MPTIHAGNQRLLTLILNEQTGAITRNDHHLLRLLVSAGCVTARLIPDLANDKTQLVLTPKGIGYLSHLRTGGSQMDRPKSYDRRSSDSRLIEGPASVCSYGSA